MIVTHKELKMKIEEANIDAVAKELHMKPKELLMESLKTYLEKRLSKLEQIFSC